MMSLIRTLSRYWSRGLAGTMELLDALPIRASLYGLATASRRAALYVKVSTADRGQSVENQLAPLQEAAGRLGWSIVARVP